MVAQTHQTASGKEATQIDRPRGGGRGTDQDRLLGLPSMLAQPDREGLSSHMLPPSLVQDASFPYSTIPRNGNRHF